MTLTRRVHPQGVHDPGEPDFTEEDREVVRRYLRSLPERPDVDVELLPNPKRPRLGSHEGR